MSEWFGVLMSILLWPFGAIIFLAELTLLGIPIATLLPI